MENIFDAMEARSRTTENLHKVLDADIDWCFRCIENHINKGSYEVTVNFNHEVREEVIDKLRSLSYRAFYPTHKNGQVEVTDKRSVYISWNKI